MAAPEPTERPDTPTDRQVRRGYVGLPVYAAAIGLAFASAVVSLVLCALIAVYYAMPQRV